MARGIPFDFRIVMVGVMTATLFCAGAKANEEMVSRKSLHTVATTLDRLQRIVIEKGFTVIARVDHAAGAAKVGQSLRPTQLLIFGNPKVGTQLLSSSQSVGLDLPIRVVCWEDEQGVVWLAYTPPETLARRHGIGNRDVLVQKMTGTLAALTQAAAN